jgi:hypothetical protein
MLGEYDPVYVAARKVLLDALDALGVHRRSIVLVGAQAVYVHAGEADIAVDPYTSDADLAVDVRLLGKEPLLEKAMRAARFKPGVQPGTWMGEGAVPVDLLVPEALDQRSALSHREYRSGSAHRIAVHSPRCRGLAHGCTSGICAGRRRRHCDVVCRSRGGATLRIAETMTGDSTAPESATQAWVLERDYKVFVAASNSGDPGFTAYTVSARSATLPTTSGRDTRAACRRHGDRAYRRNRQTPSKDRPSQDLP